MENFFREQFTFDKTARTIFFILFVIAITMMIRSIWSVVLPFVLAGIFAYVLLPFVKFVQYKLRVKNRIVSVVIVFIVVLSIISTTIILLIPSVKEEIKKTIDILSRYDTSGSILEMFIPKNINKYINSLNFNALIHENLTTENIINGTKEILNQLNNVVSGTISAFSWGLVFLIGIVYFIFILVDFEKLVKGFVNLMPQNIKPICKNILKETDYYMNSYFRGQAVIALCVALLLSVGLNIIGLPMATVIGILIGVLNFVPYMQIFGFIPLGLMCILMSVQKGENVFWCLFLGYGVMAIVQILQDTVITPSIMGKKMNMRPSLILFSISIWGYLLGFFGMLIALPLTMTIYSVYMKYILKDKEYIERQQKEMNKQNKKTSVVGKS